MTFEAVQQYVGLFFQEIASRIDSFIVHALEGSYIRVTTWLILQSFWIEE